MPEAQLNESQLESTVATHLGAHGWEYTKGVNDDGFSTELALYPNDVLTWLRNTYPDQYENAVPSDANDIVRTAYEHKLLKRLSSEISKTPHVNAKEGRVYGGLLGVLRTGFEMSNRSRPTARFKGMVAFPPQNPSMTAAAELARTNIFRVIQQVRFDTTTNQTLDLVLLVNGIPIVTIELKSDFKQTVHDAIAQYQNERQPTASRLLLQPGRCLVHFAVSNSEVYMTTKLVKKSKSLKTLFIPFNQGTRDGHAGNDPNPYGSASSYLWQKVLDTELVLRILRDYALWDPDKDNPNDGRLIFPRFHQIRAVEKVVDDVKHVGTGGRYLINHSAGSGKTKTMTWLAQRFSKSFNAQGKKQFDSVIMVSDRNVLDRNIAESLELLQVPHGTIVWAQNKHGSKSSQLKDALRGGNRIIVCTIQTFPALLKAASQIAHDEQPNDASEFLVMPRNQKYAVIIDEAHSSQHGETASAMKEVLAHFGEDEEDPNEPLTGDDLLLAIDKSVANPSNMSFIALTATPKPKTIAEYGTVNPENPAERYPFDTYPMSQAIEEGFIKDVLKRYSTYDMFGKIRDTLGGTEIVEKGEAIHEIVKFVRLHETSVSQKVQIVVEHFRRNIMDLLDGQARAMIVTDDRRAAYKWFLGMKKYLAEHGYYDMDALVAFSDSLTENEDGTGDTVTEASLNGSGATEDMFKEDNTNKVLIVANKYQTGFDEPRLMAMYVDKTLHGVMAVQTLSRLNRIYPGKPDPFVVDFVNSPDTIVESFRPFYKEAYIDQDIEPNKLHDLGQMLDSSGFYTWDQIDRLAGAYSAHKGQEKLTGMVSTISTGWHESYRNAVLTDDDVEKDRLLAFRKNLRTYKKAWDFLRQIMDFEDAQVHKRAILCSVLIPLLVLDKTREEADYTSGLTLTEISHRPREANRNLQLETVDDAETGSLPDFEGTNQGPGSPLMSELERAIAEVNQRLADNGINTSIPTSTGLLTLTYTKMHADDHVRKMVKSNSPSQLANSKKFRSLFKKSLTQAAVEKQEELEDFTQFAAMDPEMLDFLSHQFARLWGASVLGRELDENLE